MTFRNEIPRIKLSALKSLALAGALGLIGFAGFWSIPLAQGDPPEAETTKLPDSTPASSEFSPEKHSLLFRLPPSQYRGADSGPIVVKTKPSPLNEITGALAAAFSPDQPLATESLPDFTRSRDSLTEVQVMVPDTMDPREIEEFLSEINREFSVQGLPRVSLRPVLIPVRGALEESSVALAELETNVVENQQGGSKLEPSASEVRALSLRINERLTNLRVWAGQMKNWRDKSVLEKRNFVLLAVGTGRGVVSSAILYMDAASDSTNLLRMAFLFAIDVYFVLGHKHYASLAKRFNPKIFGKKIEACFKASPRLKTFIFNYFVSIGIQLVNSLGGYVAKGGAEAGLSDPLSEDGLTELGWRTARNSVLKAPALLAFEVLRNKGYMAGWKEDVVNVFIQTLAQSEGLAYGTGRLEVWRGINFTRSLTFLFMIALGRVLPPLKTIPIIFSSRLTERQIRDIEFTHGIYKATEISGTTKKESAEEFAQLATVAGPVDRMANKVELGLARIFDLTQKAVNPLQCLKLLSI